jgi:hypothetical protein
MNATGIHQGFKTTYREARDQFVGLVQEHGGVQRSFQHPAKGPEGEDLYLDLGMWGDPSADTIVLISSGTHGIEGYAGSGVQAALLRDGLTETLRDDVGFMMVHAVNPHGFAWQRRVNEDNIDLNRNFIDHTQAHPKNEGYAELAELIAPREWNDQTLGVVQEGLRAYAVERGAAAMQAALSGGQYRFPQGIFYGGTRPAWSNERVQEIARDHLGGAGRVFHVDVHTGLGDYGTAECIVEYPPGSDAAAVASQVWGARVKNTLSGESQSATVSGSIVSGLKGALRCELIGTGLEYGTVPVAQVMIALLADQWLHNHGDPHSVQGRQIKAQMREAFFPDADDWRESVVTIAREVTAQVMDYV